MTKVRNAMARVPWATVINIGSIVVCLVIVATPTIWVVRLLWAALAVVHTYLLTARWYEKRTERMLAVMTKQSDLIERLIKDLRKIGA